MADITIKCAKCGREITISEHVSVNEIPCGKCGGLIPVPGRQSSSTSLRIKNGADPAPAAPAGDLKMANPQARAPLPTTAIPAPARNAAGGGISPAQMHSMTALRRKRQERRRQKVTTLTVVGSWAIFLLLGGALAYFRFVFAPANIPVAQFDVIRRVAVIALAACYCATILMAFKDDIFQGLLALAIPLYPFYYLYAESSAVFFRASTAALLAGFGYDFFMAIQKMLMKLYEIINRFITA